MESAVMLATAALSGVNLSLHACGTYGSMLAMSFEKFIADEDLCGAVKKLIAPVEFTREAFAMDLIKRLKTSGNYLVEDHTVDRCRTEFFIPDLSDRNNHENWLALELRDITARASSLLAKRLAEYEKPRMDPKLERQLIQYVLDRKHGG
jgi:trimethylamine--corrinoid protein Co-methyltransferase